MVSVHRVRAQLKDLADTVKDQSRLALLELEPSPEERDNLKHLLLSIKAALEEMPLDRTEQMRADYNNILLGLEELEMVSAEYQLNLPPAAAPREPKNLSLPVRKAKNVRFQDEQDISSEQPVPYVDDPSISSRQLLDTNSELMLDQDRRLEQLSTSVRRQKHMGVVINTELDDQNSLLSDLEAQTDHSSSRLSRATENAAHIQRKSRQRGYCMIISILVLLLFILLVVL